METVEIVIKIPKFVYDMTKAQKKVIDADVEIVGKAIIKGTVLPKGHGKLIDSQMLKRRFEYLLHHRGYKKNLIGTGINLAIDETLDAPTIIEADKEVI